MIKDEPPSGVSGEDEQVPAIPSMGTLVIRTWNETDQMPGFRARLTYSRSPGDEPGTISTVDPDEVLSVVRQWLLSRSSSSGEVSSGEV